MFANIVPGHADIIMPSTPPTTTTGATSDFGSMVQQNTTQALQVFQNVNYKTLSGAEDQNFFASSDDNTNNDLTSLQQKFKLAPGN